MDRLKHNITNIYGNKGRQWLDELPQIITTLAKIWQVSDIKPVPNMTFHYVAKAILNNETPVVLKIGYDRISSMSECDALSHLGPAGCVKLIAYNKQYNALLMQQAIPGITLTALYTEQQDYVMDCYIQTMRNLNHQQSSIPPNTPHIADWLQALDKPAAKQVPLSLLSKAIFLKNKLLTALHDPLLLHGDLHHDNILSHDNTWLAIDPKGVIGENEFEIAAFEFMYIKELATAPEVKTLLTKRFTLLAKKAGLDPQRILDWMFVRLILMAAWCLEDNDDPSMAIQLAALIH